MSGFDLNTDSDLDQNAEKAWPQTLEDAGLPKEGWQLQRLSRRDDPKISALTQLATHKDGRRLVYRFQFRPRDKGKFQTYADLQKDAFQRFPNSHLISMPRPIFSDPEQQVSLTEFVSGKVLAEAMGAYEPGAAEQLDLVQKAGVWLDAFHRSSNLENRAFQPKFTLGYYNRMRGKIRSGERSIAAQPLFLKGIAHLNEIAPGFADRQTVASRPHGDFHMRNLIVDNKRISGFDVTGEGRTPVGHDIARLLLDYTANCRPVDEVPEGEVATPDAVEAFFDGYTLVGPDDPSVQFLLRARILAALQHVQPKACNRTEGKKRTLNQMRSIGWNAFKQAEAGNIASPRAEAVFFYLTPQSSKKAQQGAHPMVNLLREVAKASGSEVQVKRNNQRNRDAHDPQSRSLVHMSHPVGPKGLVFRRMYAGDFWAVEPAAERWQWDVARNDFDPGKIDGERARAFFGKWRDELFGSCHVQAQDEGFVYAPLQGKLLQQRSFQSTSPIEMLQSTLRETDLPVRATLHPNETYSEPEITALYALAKQEPRLTVEDLPMAAALSGCRFIVTENSSAAFHGLFFKKPAVLFAKSDFHHICFSVSENPDALRAAFDAVYSVQREYEKYLFWYWSEHAIDLSAPDAAQQLKERLNSFGWDL